MFRGYSGAVHPDPLDSFLDCVNRNPSKTAVVSGGRSLTYRDLHESGLEVARRLRDAGLPPGSFVGLDASRDLGLLTALVGVWLADLVYVPLDPAYPSRRTEYISANTGLRATLRSTESGHEIVTHASGAEPAEPWSGYVIYTSGSTGNPKGVPVHRAAVGQLLGSALPLFDFDERDVWALLHSYNFDVSVWEVWGALTTGACLVVPDHETLVSPDATNSFLAQHRVTILNQVPSVFAHLVDALDDVGATVPDVRHVIFAGERLHMEALDRWRKNHRAEVSNLYGITEATVHATFRRIADDETIDRTRTPIGSPFPGLAHRVVDADLKEVADGHVGELLLSGLQVFEGYLGVPSAENARLVAIDGRMWLRTGDLVVRGPDMLYVGREDDQAQIRGFRIEMGEIEAAAATVPGVHDQAACIVDGFGGPQLALAILVNGDGSDIAHRARCHLQDVLPSYMVPSRVAVVSALPQTPSGKLDRRTLTQQLSTR